MTYYVAFYSYKGGVGRTLALANIAYSLAQRGKCVALLDLDLEAPGLRQFKEFRLPKNRRGFLDYATLYHRDGKCDTVEGFVHKCDLSFDEGELWLMPSGKQDAGYQNRLGNLSWRRLHDQVGTMPFIEQLQKQIEEHARPHYVLIDARTGLSDIGGLSTNRMADMVVLVFNLTRECIEGSAEACGSFLHRDSRPRVVQLVASPVPPSAGGKKDRVEEQLRLAAKKMSEALRYERGIVRVDYDPAMVLAEELAVCDRSRYAAAQRYDELRESIQRANPGEVWVALEDARELRKSGSLDQAIDLLRAFAEDHKDNAEGWLELGQFLLESGRSQEAIIAFRKSCGIAPRFSAPYHHLGEALLAADQAREAIEELERAQQLGDVSSDLLGLLAEAYAGIGDTERYAEIRRRYAANLFGSLKSSGGSKKIDPSHLHQEFVEVLGLRSPYPGFDAESFWQLLMGSFSFSMAEKAKIARSLLSGELGLNQVLEFHRILTVEQKQSVEVFGPESIEVHRRVAEGLYDPRDKNSLRKALRGDYFDVLFLRLASTLTSDLDEKIDLLQEAIAIAPNSQRTLNDLLRVYANRASAGETELWVSAAVEVVTNFKWAKSTNADIELETGVVISHLFSQALNKDLLSILAKEGLKKYEVAAKIDPSSYDVFNMWGHTLSALAAISAGKEQQELYTQAFKKYAQAVKIKSDFHEAFYNWGNSLSAFAGVSDGKKRHERYRQAFEKYAQALEIKPDKYGALNNWGLALSRWAIAFEGDKRRARYREAFEKYGQALEAKPDLHEAFYNWGNGLSALASVSEGEKQRELYREAFKKYDQALKIKPDRLDALNNWGNGLLALAMVCKGDDRQRYLFKAREYYHRASALQSHAADYNLACANSLLGELELAADLLAPELLRRESMIGHALEDADLKPIWSAFPDLHAAVKACQTTEKLTPLEAWLERRENRSS